MFNWLKKLFKKMEPLNINICVDPGHGLSNSKPGVYDPGAVAGKLQLTEADIVLKWGLELEKQLRESGFNAIVTRDKKLTPCSLGSRVQKAKAFKSEVLISLHCNAATGKATGTETFFRSQRGKRIANVVNTNLVNVLGLKNRGIKHESESARGKIFVLSYEQSILIELGFIDNPTDYSVITNEEKIIKGCESIVQSLLFLYDTKNP
jgi:N-acetylmuramoyl-L-alanine amidase